MKQTTRLYFILVFIFFSFQCSNKPNINPKKQNIEFLIEKGIIYWEQRTDSLKLEKAKHFITLAQENRPNDFQLKILLSKIGYTQSLFFEKKSSIKSELFWNNSQICQDAVLAHKDFVQLYNNNKTDDYSQMINLLSEAPKSVLPGLFWWATNLGRYLNEKPVLERLKYRELLEVLMHRIISLDPSFYYSGPYRFFGSLYSRIPGIELSQSKSYFDQALQAHPEYLGNLVHIAEYYYQKSGNREQFNKTLNIVINTDINENPELMAENFLYQKRAKLLLSKEASLFE